MKKKTETEEGRKALLRICCPPEDRQTPTWTSGSGQPMKQPNYYTHTPEPVRFTYDGLEGASAPSPALNAR